MRLLTGRERLAPPPARRRAMSTGMGLFLIAAGAILLFALPTGSFGVNLHIVGVIVIVVGILGLLLPAVVQGPKLDRLRRWVNPSGQDGPGRRRDEL